jgi:hypothetical protein
MQNWFGDGYWLSILDGDARGRALFERHYSCYQYKDKRKRTIFVGPGEKMLLMTANCDALFVWRKFKSKDNQEGVNCSVFRNESPILSSLLIEEAVESAWRRWPGQRLYTYVAGNKVQSTNPGYCFIKAGWRKCGITKVNKLLIFELLPTND